MQRLSRIYPEWMYPVQIYPGTGESMIARLHTNGCEVRVDLGNTGKNWPDCPGQYQPGFPWLSFAKGTWEAAEKWAREHGATEIIRTKFEKGKVVSCE